MAELTAMWSSDGEELGTLDVEVRSGSFAGHSYAWFDQAHLKSTFIVALKAYPLDPVSPPVLEGSELMGTEGPRSVRVTVMPHDRRGTLLVRVDLASWGYPNPSSDREHTLTARFLTEYGMLTRFAEELEALLDGSKETATLRGGEP
jgi:hypothetical protein